MEPTGPLLDCWVALAEGHADPQLVRIGGQTVCHCVQRPARQLHAFNPTSDWAVAGPIIQRERIGLRDVLGSQHEPMFEAMLRRSGVTWFAQGELPLVAAMRAYVRSRFSEEQLAVDRFTRQLR